MDQTSAGHGSIDGQDVPVRREEPVAPAVDRRFVGLARLELAVGVRRVELPLEVVVLDSERLSRLGTILVLHLGPDEVVGAIALDDALLVFDGDGHGRLGVVADDGLSDGKAEDSQDDQHADGDEFETGRAVVTSHVAHTFQCLTGMESP